MFTPQRSTWSPKPRVSSETPKSKGKGIARNHDFAVAPPAPPLDSLNGGELDRDGEDMDAWKRFKKEGLLDKSFFHKKGREVLASRILELEKELHDYQYSMGLLLIEKKEWSSNMEELKARLAEAEDSLKRGKAADMIALAESERREDNLCKALGVKMQWISDLEKALREMQSENAELKHAYGKKMAEAYALDASIREKNLEIERKLHSADAMLSEGTRKSSEINKKLEDVEERESKLLREMESICCERKALEKDVSEQREHLQECNKKVHDSQNTLLDGQMRFSERQERTNAAERAPKKMQEELEKEKRSIEGTNTLKSKEEEIELKMENLQKKEKELLEVEQKLNHREREVNHKQELINKREKRLESKMNKIDIKDKDLETEPEALKMWEESLKSEEKKLIVEKDQIMEDMHKLKTSMNELQSLRDALKAEEHQIAKDREKLEISRREREQYIQKQSELKQEIEKYMNMKAELSKEIDSLREEREKLEKERESLNEENLMLQGGTKKIHGEKEKLEKWHHKEQERLRNKEINANAEIERQLEDIELQKEAFENSMEHEKTMAQEEVTEQLADVTRELELRKHEIGMTMQKKQEDTETKLKEKDKEFETFKEAELNSITSVINLNDSKIQKLPIEQDKLDREKEEVALQKKKLHVEKVCENCPTPVAVVEDGKAILGEYSKGENTKESSLQNNEESQDASIYTGSTINKRQNRGRDMINSEINAEESESQSQSISIGRGRHKKRKTSTTSGVQTPTGEKRYNLRRSTIAKNSGATIQAVSDQAKVQINCKPSSSRK